MVPRCSKILPILFLFLLLFILYIFVILTQLSYAKNNTKQHLNPNPGMCMENTTLFQDLLKKLKRLQSNFDALQNKYSLLLPKQHAIGKKDKSVKSKASLLPRPDEHQLANNVTLFAELVTVVLYKKSTTTWSCLQSRQKSLRQLFPKIKVLIGTSNASTVGSTFNLMIKKVNTKYFLFLDSQHELFDQASDHSSGWLLHALENIPELDFVSGSILNSDKLEIPCYRLLLCNWTLSQRYEYRRSIGELMICENIAPSFMGRTSSIGRIFSNQTLVFDENIETLSTTDFFLRAKKAGALSGVRPEVMFKVSQDSTCNFTVTVARRDYFLSLLPFAHKHKVFRFKKADSETLDICDSDSPIVGEDICDESTAHKIMLDGGHWAYDGTFAYPYMISNLQHSLFKVTEFLSSKGISYSIEGGIPLGAVKLRGVLPWDAGDVDIFVYYKSLSKLFTIVSKFAKDNDFFASNRTGGQIQVYCVPSKLETRMGGLVSLFVREGKPPEKFIHIKTNGKWIPYRRDIFRNLRKYYKLNYLQHRMYMTDKVTHCKKEGHNACLPDFRKLESVDSGGGTFKDYFCDSS